MQLRFGIILIVVALIEKSLQTCTAINNVIIRYPSYIRYRRISRYPMRPTPLGGIRKYIECQDETMSADFHNKIEPLVEGAIIDWLQINNTNSPEISSEAFDTLQMITDLRINSAGVQVIQPGALNGLFNLSKLSLKNNRINNLKEHYFSNLSNLVEIDLSFNNIENIDQQAFFELQKLQRLYLGNNLIVSLPPEVFEEQSNLDTLDLSFNKIVEIDSRLFKNLTKLVALWLNNNHLNSINSDLLSDNLQLRDLYINNNYLTVLNNFTFPKSIFAVNGSANLLHHFHFANFTEIKVIDLSRNGMTQLYPDTFKNLAVKELYLDRNFYGINLIPAETFNNLTDLEVISLSNNQIRQLTPKLFQKNINLRRLNLAQNYLNNLPNLPISIVNLNLTGNNFGSSLNITYKTNLIFLNISFNNLTQITFHFFDGLTSLFYLSLHNNKITKLNVGCFRKLKGLKYLDLSYNNIKALEIGAFVGIDNLVDLDISHNNLNFLSNDIFHNLKALRRLKFGYNNITFISVENTLSHLTWLQEVDLAGNDWTCSVLTTFIKKFERAKLINGGDFNVTNVEGIACRDELKESKNLDNLQLKYIDRVTSKLATNNNLLIFIIIIMLVMMMIMLKYSKICLKKSKKLITREKSEQELQLI